MQTHFWVLGLIHASLYSATREGLIPMNNMESSCHGNTSKLNTLVYVRTHMGTHSKHKLSRNTGPWSHKLSVKATLIFPPPSPSVNPGDPVIQGHSPLCTSAVLDSQAGRRGEGTIWGPAVRVLCFGKAWGAGG